MENNMKNILFQFKKKYKKTHDQLNCFIELHLSVKTFIKNKMSIFFCIFSMSKLISKVANYCEMCIFQFLFLHFNFNL